MPAGFQQPPVLKLSPDYKVFLNGLSSLPIQSAPTDAQLAPLNRGTVHYRDLNTDISGCTISMGVEGSPGTASFTINVPRHRTDALAYIRDGDIAVKPMMEVHIYLRGRFNDADNSPKYYLSFWGIVSTVQEQYSDGTHSLSVSCTDILRWWQITKIVTSPAAIAAAEVPGQGVTGLSSIYTGLDAHTIIYDLGKFSMQNFMLPSPVNVGDGLEQTQQTSLFNREATITAGYWRDRFKAIRSAQRLFGFDGFIKCSTQVLGPNKPDVTSQNEADVESDQRALKEDVAGSNYIYTKVRTCDNQIQAVYPYKTSEGREVGQSESQQRSKLEVAQEVANNIHWEFFLDMDGTIVFKPPFYNLDVRSNEPSVIRDIDIINYTRTETEQGALTSLYVSARQVNPQQAQSIFGGWWIDWPLALTLGLRHEPREEWRIMDPKLAKTFAQAELVRHNSMLETLAITIPGRPELRLGYPVYIEPLDSFYYVYNIDHTITAGATFTTTLSLKSKRTRIRDASGRPQRLLAAVQSKEIEQDDANRENAPTCPTFANSAIQLLADSRGRADASGSRDERSGKGKSIVNMTVLNVTDSELEAEERRRKETQDVLDADPCNKDYEKIVIGDVRTVNTKHKDNRLTKDGVAPGEWVLKENHPVIPQSAGSNNRTPVDGKDVVDKIQLSDEQGYKLFGPFLYARFVSLSGEGVMESASTDPVDNTSTRDASQVQNSQADPGAAGADASAGLRYLVNPNVGAVTLRLGTGAVSRTGAGVSGEAFVATRSASDEASRQKRDAARPIQIGKVSVDSINNCEGGSVGIKAGSDTPEAQEEYAKLRSCQNQGRQKAPTLLDVVRQEAEAFQEGS